MSRDHEPRYTYDKMPDDTYPITDQHTEDVVATLTDTTEDAAYSIVAALNRDYDRMGRA